MGLSNALLAGSLALVALVVGRFSRRPALVHCLWVLVLLKLVTPPVVSLPVPGWQTTEPTVAESPAVVGEQAAETPAVVRVTPPPEAPPALSPPAPQSYADGPCPSASGRPPRPPPTGPPPPAIPPPSP